MVIFKIAKEVAKLIIGTALGIAIGVGIIVGTINYFRSEQAPEKNMSECIHAYNVVSNSPDNGWHLCPVCRTTFYKTNGHNFCSPKCETEFKDLKRSWDLAMGGIKNIERHGKRFN